MPSWTNRTVLSGSSINRNGTNSHTCTFTTATAGNLLVAIIGGAQTSSTPTGWSLLTSAVGSCGLYVFTKTASAGENSFTTTHNGTNYPIEGVVYEFLAGSASIGTPGTTTSLLANSSVTGPSTTGLTGSYTRFSAKTQGIPSSISTPTTSWTLPSTNNYDAYIDFAATDGIYLTIAFDDNSTGSSFNPSSNTTSGNGANMEGVSFALSIATPSLTPLPWLRF